MADMHPEDIKAAIRKKGMTIAALAEANGMSKQALAMAIGARVSAPAEAIIARFIGMEPAKIWPSLYLSDGRRITMSRTGRQKQKRAAGGRG